MKSKTGLGEGFPSGIMAANEVFVGYANEVYRLDGKTSTGNKRRYLLQ